MFKMKKLACLIGGCGVVAMPALAAQTDEGMEPGAPAFDQLAAAETAVKLPSGSSSATLIQALLEKARYWKARNRMDFASSTWERVLRSDPKQPEALAGLGLYQASMGRFDSARDYLNKLKLASPGYPAIGELERAISPAVHKPAPAAEAAAVADPALAARSSLHSQYVALLNQGAQARKQKRPGEAQTHFRSAAALMPNMPEAPTALADLLLEQGDLAGAEAGYRAVLGTSPGYIDATLGLARVLVKQKRYDDALALVSRLDSGGQNAASSGVRAEAYLRMGGISEDAGNDTAALDYYRKAQSLRPGDPWVTLSLSRLLRKQGETEAARSGIEQMTAKARDRDTNYAAALFYSEGNQWVQALALLDEIPAQDRTERMVELRSRAVVYVRSGLARSLHAEGAGGDAAGMLATAEGDAAGKPELVSMTAAAWMDIGQPGRAATFLERNKPLTPDLQLQYAGALLQSNQDEKLEQVLGEIDRRGGEANFKPGALDRIRVALAVRKADALRMDGKVAEGQGVLKPMLARHPQDADLLLAQARLQGAAGDLKGGLEIVDAVLTKMPGNHEAIRQGTEYAIRQDDYTRADSYLAGSSPADAERAALYLEAAHLAEAKQDNEQAAKYYKIANELGAKGKVVDIFASPERLLAGSEARHNAYLEAGYAMRYKSGMSGLGYMYEQEIPAAWHIPLEGAQSSLVLKATDVKLDAGDLGPGLDLFGTNRPVLGVPPGIIRANGVALSAGYQSNALSADIGVSPLGFQVDNLVGGLRWNRDIVGSNIAVEVSRRSVAESVLSYAGAVDNKTGLAWGGVVKTGAQASAYYPFGGKWAGYASAGWYDYRGANVAGNTSTHLNATLIYEAARTDVYEATVSARLSGASFDNNQNWFFWGHGGYYSPQREIGLTVPVHVAGKAQKLVYELNISGTIADVVEAASPVYPTDPVRQAGLGAAGMRAATVNSSKGSWRLDWTVEYAIAPQLVLGNRFHYDESRTYQQLGAMLYLRYDLDKKGGPGKFPPNPIRPYYITTQGGAGLN